MSSTLRTLIAHRPTFEELADSGAIFPRLTYMAIFYVL